MSLFLDYIFIIGLLIVIIAAVVYDIRAARTLSDPEVIDDPVLASVRTNLRWSAALSILGVIFIFGLGLWILFMNDDNAKRPWAKAMLVIAAMLALIAGTFSAIAAANINKSDAASTSPDITDKARGEAIIAAVLSFIAIGAIIFLYLLMWILGRGKKKEKQEEYELQELQRRLEEL